MDQRLIVVFLPLKGLLAKAKDIYTELGDVLRSDAIAYSTEIKDMQNDVILQNEPEAEDRADDQGFSTTHNAILEALEMMPFDSICQIAKITLIPLATRFHRLPKSLHFF
jgi:hypothetical protein